ncbi:transglutaminase-like domain-containing protein [Cupriavidus sp. 2TAF22]|uniref:transglutaminase-like domain-containing protein n=1 Tax=unclassified Cupriavidus TaxID=2640874 RepID=UPI003F8E124B
MDRRSFLKAGAAAPVLASTAGLARAGAQGAEALPAAEGWRIYEVTTEVTLPAAAAPASVWVPMTAARIDDYQRTLSTTWSAPGAMARDTLAPGYDARMLALRWPGPDAVEGKPLHATLTNVVALRDRKTDLGQPPSARAPRESAATLREYLRPTRLLPTDGIVKATALQITAGAPDDMTRARALYEWVIDHTCREASVRGCGVGDVQAMLRTGGIMNGKCADINGLFVALARASGIPARDAYGVRVDTSAYGFKAMGKAGDISKAQHCRAEFYNAGYGWVPVDPADVRKVALEEAPGGLPMTHWKVRSARAMLFGAWEMNWVAYNHGHDVALPGSKEAPVPFLMYPNGESVAGTLDSVDPAAFGYRIASRRIA